MLATFLGTDPINFGGTADQKRKWLGRLAEEGFLVAYAATEPQAGSDLAALSTRATPVLEDARLQGAVKSPYHRTFLALRDQLGDQNINLEGE